MDNKIDFVITWVDGSDKQWINERNKYSNNKIDESRYRDWKILKYWFRAVEKYASWVNKVYFVTWGHIPNWLDTKYEKLVVVRHDEFIDKKYLPTFNSCVIELNLHKIKKLSSNFVYFNDDMFINDYVQSEDFFKNKVPCDFLDYNWIWKKGKVSTIINYNCQKIIDRNFNLKKEKIKKDLKYYIKRAIYLDCKPVLALIPQHVPTSYCKDTFYDIWKKESQYLNNVCYDKFRKNNDVSQWVVEFWQIATGNFEKRQEKFSKYYEIDSETLNESIMEIMEHKYKLICINDSENTTDFEKNKQMLIEMFGKMFPNKSAFEK